MADNAPTVHLVYPHGPSIAQPNSVGRHLGERLSRWYRVAYHDIQESGVITPNAGDVLVGHAWPTFSLFSRSAKRAGWRRVLLLQPYCHGHPVGAQESFVERIIERCDLFLAITGKYWFVDIPHSEWRHWLPKMRHVDLAVDRTEFPVLKVTFNPPGRRRFVYIGHDNPYKNLPYLDRLAGSMPGSVFSWIGTGRMLRNVHSLGRLDFATDEGKAEVAKHDFLITVGCADGNPTTILEAMSFGLIPVCTPQSGYCDIRGIINIPLNDVDGAIPVLKRLQELPDADLKEIQAQNWSLLDSHYNWDRFAEQVRAAIESNESPACDAVPINRRVSAIARSFAHPRLDAWPAARRAGKLCRDAVSLAWRRDRRSSTNATSR